MPQQKPYFFNIINLLEDAGFSDFSNEATKIFDNLKNFTSGQRVQGLDGFVGTLPGTDVPAYSQDAVNYFRLKIIGEIIKRHKPNLPELDHIEFFKNFDEAVESIRLPNFSVSPKTTFRYDIRESDRYLGSGEDFSYRPIELGLQTLYYLSTLGFLGKAELEILTVGNSAKIAEPDQENIARSLIDELHAAYTYPPEGVVIDNTYNRGVESLARAMALKSAYLGE